MYGAIPNNPYPDFDSAEILPESQLMIDGRQYNLKWARGKDAVGSALMSTRVLNEHVRDLETDSHTDWVITFPTQRMYVTARQLKRRSLSRSYTSSYPLFNKRISISHPFATSYRTPCH